MPCAGPPPPSDKDRQTRKMHRSIKFVMDHLGEEIPHWVTSGIADEYGGDFERATVELCRLCRLVDEDFIYNGRIPQARALADWYDDHKAHDIAVEEYRERERQSRAREAEKTLKRLKLIARMSDEELALLGIKRPS